MLRLALSGTDATRVTEHFSDTAPDESGVFMLLRAAPTASGVRYVATEPYIPGAGEWELVGPDQLRPSTRLLSAMANRAQAAQAGLLFIHSHPLPGHPTAFSIPDMSALNSLATVTPDLFDGPFAAAIVGPRGWAALALDGGLWEPIDRITSAARTLTILSDEAAPCDADLDSRQIRALGAIHQALRLLDVALVGAGGLSSPAAEAMHRMGIRSMTVIDFDRLDTPSNVRRVVGSKMSDFDREVAPYKADVVANHLSAIGLDGRVGAVVGDVRDEATLPALLDADVLLCGTDSHSSRAALNAIAYAFHLPLIDCGVQVGTRLDGALECLTAQIRVVGPGLACLWCMSAISADRVYTENLPAGRRESLAEDGYIMGEDGVVPSVGALTTTGAGLMASALLGMLSDDGDRLPQRYAVDALSGFGTAMPVEPNDRCICHMTEGLALAAPLGLR